MPPTVAVDTDVGSVVFERPRHLGPGVEFFNVNDVPTTPYGSFFKPEEYPSTLNIDETLFAQSENSGRRSRSFDLHASKGVSGSESQTPHDESIYTSSVERSFVFGQKALGTQLRRILLIGPPGLLSTHVAARLLKNGHYVRLLERYYRGKAALRGLEKLVETRPSRLSLFCGDNFLLSVADCDAVVYINGPDALETFEESDTEHRFVRSIQDLFFAIINNGKSVKRVVLIIPASSVFPVETTLVVGSRGLQPAQTAALREAERMSDRARIPLTVILPAMVVGPSLFGEHDGNVHALVRFAGKRRLYTSPFYYNIVDVRDVAEACGLVLMSRTAEYQKYILSGGEMDLGQISSVLRECIPGIKPPRRKMPVFLARLLLYFGFLKLVGFEFCERIAFERVGWSFALSSVKAQRDLEISLRSASSAVVAAVAHAMNVSAVLPQSLTTNAWAPQTKNDCGQQNGRHKELLIAGLCAVFGAIGFVGGKYLC